MNITFRQQRRKSIALQVTPQGLQVLIPQGISENDAQVQSFIKQSLDTMPEPPKRLEKPHEVEEIYALVASWAEKIGVDVVRVQIRKMKTKWGSVSTAGYVTLADDLRWIPLPLVEYVIVHELMHLKLPNHDKGWQASMGMYVTNWRLKDKQIQAYLLNQVIA